MAKLKVNHISHSVSAIFYRLCFSVFFLFFLSFFPSYLFSSSLFCIISTKNQHTELIIGKQSTIVGTLLQISLFTVRSLLQKVLLNKSHRFELTTRENKPAHIRPVYIRRVMTTPLLGNRELEMTHQTKIS